MEVLIGKTYKHFKGNLYKIMCISLDSEDINKEIVVYKSLDNETTWARPLEDFISKVDKIKYPDCTQEYRFSLYD